MTENSHPSFKIAPDSFETRLHANGCSLEATAFNAGFWEVHATRHDPVDSCPFCGSHDLKRHGWSKGRYLDAPFDERPVHLHIQRPRLRCVQCRKTLTPLIPGIIERHRVTDRVLSFLRLRLLPNWSVRELARVISAQPKTVTTLLMELADCARRSVEVPAEVGIHRLSIGKTVVLVVSNLVTATAVDVFSPDRGLLGKLLPAILKSPSLQSVSIPANIEIAKSLVACSPPQSLRISFSALEDLAVRVLVSSLKLWFRSGRRNSVTAGGARRIAAIRRNMLSDWESECFDQGIAHQLPFWLAYREKERLLESLDRPSVCLMGVVRDWNREIEPSLRPVFFEIVNTVIQLDSMGIKYHASISDTEIASALDRVQISLTRSGTPYSQEMLAALLLALPFLLLPIERSIGQKGRGPVWLEVEEKEERHAIATHLGEMLPVLANLLEQMSEPVQSPGHCTSTNGTQHTLGRTK